MKHLCASLLSLLILTSCSSLKSLTTIKPHDSFILGDNDHGPFRASLTNLSQNTVEVYQRPVGGEKAASQSVAPNETVSVSLPANTALVIANKNSDTANVKLKVKGDTGLGMQYRQYLK